MSHANIKALQLRDLANKELELASASVKHMDPIVRAAFFTEICRVMDYYHVIYNFSKDPAQKLSIPDFDIMVRGWNPAVVTLLSNPGNFKGMPLMESTPETFRDAMAYLHQLGRYYYLNQAADMVSRDIVISTNTSPGHITIEATPDALAGLFKDQVEFNKLITLENTILDVSHNMESDTADIEQQVNSCIFPWHTKQGTMIGYNTTPDIDAYFISETSKIVDRWILEAGIDQDVKIHGMTSSDIMAVGHLLASIHLKHIYFLAHGIKLIPDANYPMSLTAYDEDKKAVYPISQLLNISQDHVSNAVELFTLNPESLEFFQNELTPYIPLRIQISDGYILRPVSSIFRNPFVGMRNMQTTRSGKVSNLIREPRENWMISDLLNLFRGPRYRVIDTPTKLRRGDDIVTDIDAAVLDTATGVLALFQLKWQDFESASFNKRLSKAKNFTEQIDTWAGKVNSWISEFGLNNLVALFHFKATSAERISAVKIFAIGRIAAHFKHFGCTNHNTSVAIASWPQFVRLRYEIGSSNNVITDLHVKISQEYIILPRTKAIPYEMKTNGITILFKNMWHSLDG